MKNATVLIGHALALAAVICGCGIIPQDTTEIDTYLILTAAGAAAQVSENNTAPDTPDNPSKAPRPADCRADGCSNGRLSHQGNIYDCEVCDLDGDGNPIDPLQAPPQFVPSIENLESPIAEITLRINADSKEGRALDSILLNDDVVEKLSRFTVTREQAGKTEMIVHLGDQPPVTINPETRGNPLGNVARFLAFLNIVEEENEQASIDDGGGPGPVPDPPEPSE